VASLSHALSFSLSLSFSLLFSIATWKKGNTREEEESKKVERGRNAKAWRWVVDAPLLQWL